jgi:hypothetical protein
MSPVRLLLVAVAVAVSPAALGENMAPNPYTTIEGLGEAAGRKGVGFHQRHLSRQ